MIAIGGRNIEMFCEPYVIAEIGANHSGDLTLAIRLIDAAKEAGCDCVKFQSWTADSIFSAQPYRDNYFLGDDYRSRTDFTLREIVEAYSLSGPQLRLLAAHAAAVGIHFASTPFSEAEVDFLCKDLQPPFIKVASMDCNNYPFLEYVARKGLPIVLSTGLSTLAEVDRAVATIEASSSAPLILLHCVASYPPRDEAMNLRNISMLSQTYPHIPVGFSDHSLGGTLSNAAVALGACMIEKHFTLDRNMEGWDHRVSATPDEMAAIVLESKRVAKALGSYRRIVSADEITKRGSFRRSIVAARDIPAGKVLAPDDLTTKRPGTGLPPEQLHWIVGRVAKNSIARDEMLTADDV